MRRLMFVFIILALVLQAPKSYSATEPANYCYVPPFAGNMVKPNVLIVMDFSDSMQSRAYSSTNYDPKTTYSGYFEPGKCYKYNSSGQYFEEANCDCPNGIGTSSCISGNLLNWVSATRIDIARKILTGGRRESRDVLVNGRRESRDVLVSEGAEYTIEDKNLNCYFEIKAPQTHNRELTIECPRGVSIISSAKIAVRPSDPSSIKGIIHNFCNTSDPDLPIYKQCQIIMEFMVFASDDRYGVIKVGKNGTIAQLIDAINYGTPTGEKTPTGKALREAYDYYRQIDFYDYASNSNHISKGN
ncbi:MAG: hypothetical protein ACK4FY_07130, partial [Aquificaceae bacterium]